MLSCCAVVSMFLIVNAALIVYNSLIDIVIVLRSQSVTGLWESQLALQNNIVRRLFIQL